MWSKVFFNEDLSQDEFPNSIAGESMFVTVDDTTCPSVSTTRIQMELPRDARQSRGALCRQLRDELQGTLWSSLNFYLTALHTRVERDRLETPLPGQGLQMLSARLIFELRYRKADFENISIKLEGYAWDGALENPSLPSHAMGEMKLRLKWRNAFVGDGKGICGGLDWIDVGQPFLVTLGSRTALRFPREVRPNGFEYFCQFCEVLVKDRNCEETVYLVTCFPAPPEHYRDRKHKLTSSSRGLTGRKQR
jgi:hypothetical protein